VPPLAVGAVERELSELGGRLNEEREQLVMATVSLGGIAEALDRKAPTGREAAETKGLILMLLNERRRETASLELKTALLAEQLRRYKETGVLSPTPAATVASLKKLVDEPWAVWRGRTPVASLSLDLALLQKQLRRWRQAAETFPPPMKRKPPPSAAEGLIGGGFERDRGTGKAESDPIPALTAQLSAPEPRRRAMAADALGSRGASAAAAVPALTLALSDPDRRVRASAALALGAVGSVPWGAAEALRLALNDRDAEVRLSARLALRRLDGD